MATNGSFVYWYGTSEGHRCGYCGSETGSISDGMMAASLTVEDYQNLIDRGWRRSGRYCYKPLMKEGCCPMYTIKCEALDFKVSKSQKKVLKKFNKFLKDGILLKTENVPDADSFEGISEFVYREAPRGLPDNFASSTDVVDGINPIEEAVNPVNNVDNEQGTSKSIVTESYQIKKRVDPPRSGVGADPNKPPCKKAKLLRLERKQEKLLKRGMSLDKIPVVSEQKSLEEFIQEVTPDLKHKFQLELINSGRQGEDWKKVKNVVFNVYKKYQMIIHNDLPEKCTMDGFMRFLVHSPLQYVKFPGEPVLGYGSFHQLYWLDDKLIAVGVIDILPKCVSSVYFFYDPDYRSLVLGTYGALREIEFMRSLHKKVPSIEYYYMGYYIHACQKMRYKGKLTPSYLLCPETYQWVPIEKCVPKLDINKYSRLVDDEEAKDDNDCSSHDIENMNIVHQRKIMTLRQFRRIWYEEDLFEKIGTLIGKKCCRSLIFVDF